MNIIIPPADIKTLEQKMRPGVLSAGGFLGNNESLSDIIVEDNNTLSSIGVSHKQIETKLTELIDLALNSGTKKYSNQDFRVKVNIFTGFQICPWTRNIHQEQCIFGSGVKYGSIDWIITNKKKKLTVSGPGLLVHLIGDHHFFEGKESTYRIEPQLLCSLLNLLD